MGISLSTGNTKLNKPNGGTYSIIGFGIPADFDFAGGNTCPGALACRSICYAKQGTYNFPAVKAARLSNLTASQGSSFVADMVASLRRRRSVNVVRIHDSGDFYSQAYYDAWCEIARAIPGKVFYAYTKALNLDLWSRRPDNLRIIQSLGGRWDNLVDLTRPHSRIFGTEQARVNAGYVDGNVNDVPAIEGEIRIGLVYHGVKSLTPAQERYWV